LDAGTWENEYSEKWDRAMAQENRIIFFVRGMHMIANGYFH